MSEVKVFNLEGKAAGSVKVPAVFSTPLRPDLVRKAVKVARANRRQRYGASPVAGERHSTESVGKGKGASRVPRLKQGSDAALAPSNVGGRRAHPPESRHFWKLQMNVKERRLAIASAIAATSQAETVKARGHKFADATQFPVVVTDDFVSSAKTAALAEALVKLGLGDDLTRAVEGTHERPGIGKLRGRRIRTPRSVLLVTADGKSPGARNIPGVEVVSARNIGAEHLAPGGDMGRLTVYTKGAIAHLTEAFQ